MIFLSILLHKQSKNACILQNACKLKNANNNYIAWLIVKNVPRGVMQLVEREYCGMPVKNSLLRCIEPPKKIVNFLSSGKLRVTTPFFDRGTF